MEASQTQLKGKLAQLKLLALQRQLERAQAEHAALKEAVHSEVDLQRESRKTEKLRAKLEQLALNEARLAGQLGYGLPPGWGTAASGSASSSPSFSWSGTWQAGTEVQYAVRTKEGSEASSSSLSSGQQVDVQLSQLPVKLQRSALPFAMGGLRMAFYARDEAGSKFVLKRALLESSKPEKRVAELHADAEAAALSSAAAAAFSKVAGRFGQITYLTASVVVLEEEGSPGGKAVYLKEPWIDGSSAGGRWIKWTRNDGHVFPEGMDAAAVQAFTHFSLLWLRQQLGCSAMVLDTQGFQRGATSFILTDPAICSDCKRFGKADFGSAAISAFLAAHTCGATCSACGCAGTRL